MKQHTTQLMLMARQLRQPWWKLWLLSIAVVSGYGANLIGVPAAWFIAPLVVALILALVRVSQLFIPVRANVLILTVIGVAISASFQRSSLVLLGQYWLVLLAACL